MTVTVPSGRRSRTKLIWLVAGRRVHDRARAGRAARRCRQPALHLDRVRRQPALPVGSGPWIATAYGPPWDAIKASASTATGLNLTAGTARATRSPSTRR